MNKINMVFFGTPDFSVPTLDMLYNHPVVNLKYVISMPDRPAGRGQQLKSPEVIEFAKAHKIPFFQTENINKEEKFLAKLKDENIDSFLVLAFAQFLSQKVLDLPKDGCFNIHTSLLPKYRGAAPIQYALLNGDTSTGVSIQRMVKKMDAGDLCWSRDVQIHPTETGGQLYTKLKFEAALATNDFVYALSEDKVEFTPQNEADVSIAPTLKREDGHLDFKNQSFDEINNRVRALFPWPGTFCKMNGKRLKIFRIEKTQESLKPGVVSTKGNQLLIGTKSETIRLAELQFEGKKRCSDTDLLNGLKVDITINS